MENELRQLIEAKEKMMLAEISLDTMKGKTALETLAYKNMAKNIREKGINPLMDLIFDCQRILDAKKKDKNSFCVNCCEECPAITDPIGNGTDYYCGMDGHIIDPRNIRMISSECPMKG